MKFKIHLKILKYQAFVTLLQRYKEIIIIIPYTVKRIIYQNLHEVIFKSKHYKKKGKIRKTYEKPNYHISSNWWGHWLEVLFYVLLGKKKFCQLNHDMLLIVTHILISEMLKYDQIVRLRIYKMWFIIVIDKQKLFIHLFLMH